jgi:hypothetical protein
VGDVVDRVRRLLGGMTNILGDVLDAVGDILGGMLERMADVVERMLQFVPETHGISSLLK